MSKFAAATVLNARSISAATEPAAGVVQSQARPVRTWPELLSRTPGNNHADHAAFHRHQETANSDRALYDLFFAVIKLFCSYSGHLRVRVPKMF